MLHTVLPVLEAQHGAALLKSASLVRLGRSLMRAYGTANNVVWDTAHPVLVHHHVLHVELVLILLTMAVFAFLVIRVPIPMRVGVTALRAKMTLDQHLYPTDKVVASARQAPFPRMVSRVYHVLLEGTVRTGIVRCVLLVHLPQLQEWRVVSFALLVLHKMDGVRLHATPFQIVSKSVLLIHNHDDCK